MRKQALAAIAVAATLGLAACSSASTPESGAAEEQSAPAEANGEQVEIEVWAWESVYEPVARRFEELNPGIKVNITNAGTGGEAYTALNNAIAAGTGTPDVVQLEYFAVPQFYFPGALLDLAPLGASEYGDFFTPGTWASVTSDESVYALPVDSGPTAMFYNEETFTAAGVTEPPTTWDEYYEAAKKIHELGPNYYIGADTGDPLVLNQFIWAAGGQPFTVEGETIGVGLDSDEGTQKFLEVYQKLIDEDLLDTKTAIWSDDWYRGLSDGTIATTTTGAWMSSLLQSGVPDGSGKWRVASTPQFDPANPVNGENGGSALAILASSQKTEAAYKFVDFLAHDVEGIDTRVALGLFPADNGTLSDPEFLGEEIPYYGNQKVNEVLAKAAEDVNPEWQFLPFQAYGNNIFGDSVGPAMQGQARLSDAIAAWQKQLVEYGQGQGFTVESK